MKYFMVAVALLGCGGSAEEDTASRSHALAVTPVVVGTDGGPLQLGPNCEAFGVAPLPMPAWWGLPLTTRMAPNPAAANNDFAGAYEFYADCYEQHIIVGACSDVIEKSLCRAGRMTIACEDDTNCPGATRCSWGHVVGARPAGRSDFGVCEKTCSADGECPYATMHCDAELGVCSTMLPGDPNIHEDAPALAP